MADENGYKYIAGIQANQESEHVVRCRTCGLPDKKTTKMLIAHSKCRYMPCKNRGVLTLQYIQDTLAPYGISLLSEPEPCEATVVSSDDKLVFEHNKKQMRERWRTIKERIRTGRLIFKEDEKHKEHNLLTDEKLKQIMQINQVKLTERKPTSWVDRVEFKCLRCGLHRFDTAKRLSSRENCDCECVKSEKRFDDFVLRVEEAGLAFDDLDDVRNQFQSIAKKNLPKQERENAYRNVRAQLRCPDCGGAFLSQSLFQIVYEFLLFCTNKNCKSFVEMRAQSDSLGLSFGSSDADLERNALILTSNFESLSHFKSAYPYVKYRLSFGVKRAVFLKKLWQRCGELSDGWKSTKVNIQKDEDITKVLLLCIKNGATAGLNSLLESAPTLNNRAFIAQVSQKFREQFRTCCEKLDYHLRNNWRNLTVEQALQEINRLKLKSRNDFKYNAQGLYGACIRKNLLAQIYAAMDWHEPIIYVDMCDNDLLSHAKNTAIELNARNITELEYQGSSALVREIRSESRSGLNENLHAILGWESAEKWRGIEMYEVLCKVLEYKIFSMTDLHKKLPGLYKELYRTGMAEKLAAEVHWGKFKSIFGRRADSLVESVVFSLMELNNIPFQTHVQTPFKSLQNTNAMKADFLLKNEHYGRQVYGEVWACNEKYPGSGFLRDYLSKRNYKQSRYDGLHDVELLSVEGIEYYKPTASLTRYVNHIAECFFKLGIKMDAGAEVIQRIRESLASSAQRKVNR
ncbi:hypothetical protein [Idiomarina aquatica]|nr:hypothetical protein [Idiomarina aquatica]